MLLAGDYTSGDIVFLVKEMFIFIKEWNDVVPGASSRDCGNYQDMNLSMAQYLADKFLVDVLNNISEARLVYPD